MPKFGKEEEICGAEFVSVEEDLSFWSDLGFWSGRGKMDDE